MGIKEFSLAGDAPSSAVQVDVSNTKDIDALKTSLAGAYAIVEPNGQCLTCVRFSGTC